MSKILTMLGTFAVLSAVTLDASAGLRVTCETRSDRSRASVDGRNLAAGLYSTRLISGPNTAASPQEAAVGGEVEFDYDSNRRDIRQGATPIAKNFIVGNTATGELLDANGQLLATKTVNCRAR